MANIHLQSTPIKPSTGTRTTTPTELTPVPSGSEPSGQGTKPKQKAKNVSFSKQAPLSPQGNKQNQNTTQSGDIIPNDNRKQHKCRICEGSHTNLVFCSRLPLYVPCGNNSISLPKYLYKICLFTGFENGANCRHNAVSL